MNEKFYTIKEIAKILKINERTVSSLIKRGVLKAVNIGTEKRAVWRIFEGHYLNFIASGYKQVNDE